MPNRLTSVEILKRIELHNSTVENYRKVFLHNPSELNDYKNQNTKITLTCLNNHIWQKGLDNLFNNGACCKICSMATVGNYYRKSLIKLRDDIYNVHGNRYTYPNIENEYKNNKSHITINCVIHGNFNQQMNCHINSGHGCPQCAIDATKSTPQEFIDKANQIHNFKYNYSKTNFIGYGNKKSKITIICPVHGEFIQHPNDHIVNKSGCPQCAQSAISYKALTWLDFIAKEQNINIHHAANGGEFQLPGTLYRIDGYCKETNTCYEFHGDAYHGNPNRYEPNTYCNPYKKITARELHEKTLKKEKMIVEHGYNLIVIWETDYDNLNIPLNVYNIKSFKTKKILTEDISIYGIELVDRIYNGYYHNHNFKCLVCNNIFQTSLGSRKQSFKGNNTVGCPTCNKPQMSDFLTTFLNKLETRNNTHLNNKVYLVDTDEYKGQHHECSFKCDNDHRFIRKPVAILYRKKVCKECRV